MLADRENGRIEKFDLDDKFLGEIPPLDRIYSLKLAGDAQQVGVKISPMHEVGASQANDETLPVTEYAIQKLNTYNLSHLLLMGNTTDFSDTPVEKLTGDGMF
jgi:hypothetical protein